MRATVGGSTPVLPGRAVLLSATETRLFGISKYRFVSYLEPPSNEQRSNSTLERTGFSRAVVRPRRVAGRSA